LKTVSSALITLLFTAVAVSGQQQYFRIQPKDIKVHEGGEALLECEVTNQAGQVQWTKDGFALGKSSCRRQVSVTLMTSAHIIFETVTSSSHFVIRSKRWWLVHKGRPHFLV